MISDIPAFEEFLASELRGIGPGFVAGCLALANADTLTRSERRDLCERIMFDKRVRLVGALTNDLCAAAVIKCLSKLEIDSLDPESWAECLRSLHDPCKTRIVRHIKVLTPSIFRLLSQLPSWVCSIHLLQKLDQSPDHLRQLALELLHDLCHLVELQQHEVRATIASSLKQAEDGAHLLDILLRWRHRIAEQAPFPSPPIPETDLLSPLTSAKMMQCEALRMRNCIAEYISYVLSGTHYFYRWNGAEPAIVCLQRDARGPWQLGQCASVGNRSLISSIL